MSEGPKTAEAVSLGLRAHTLSAWETIAQSISAIAPSVTPTLNIPLVYALCGNQSAFAYLFAIVAIGLMAACIACFARESSSPGSLYTYVAQSLPPFAGAISGWALFFAYLATGSSVVAGFVNFACTLAGVPERTPVAVSLSLLAVTVACVVACMDVRLSARLMLTIEAASVTMILLVVGRTLIEYGPHLDRAQLRFAGFHTSGLHEGVMIAIFSFVGFESATTLGVEARDPLRTIPRALIRSALLSGLLFFVCAYGEVLAFKATSFALDHNVSPIHLLAEHAGVTVAGPIIDLCVLFSMFAAALACASAAARILLLLSHRGLAHMSFRRVHERRQTPVVAILVSGTLILLPTLVLSACGVVSTTIYGWLGTLAVFGFLSAYLLVALALFVHRRRRGTLTVPVALISLSAAGVTLAAIAGTVLPLPASPDRYFPLIYCAYLGAALLWQRQYGRER